jgi:hypothetical protein
MPGLAGLAAGGESGAVGGVAASCDGIPAVAAVDSVAAAGIAGFITGRGITGFITGFAVGAGVSVASIGIISLVVFFSASVASACAGRSVGGFGFITGRGTTGFAAAGLVGGVVASVSLPVLASTGGVATGGITCMAGCWSPVSVGFGLIIGFAMAGLATAGFGAIVSVAVIVAGCDKVVVVFVDTTSICKVYFLRTGLIRYSFCAVKLLGCISANSASHVAHRAGSALRKASVSIFFDVR